MDIIKRCADDIFHYINKYPENSERLCFIENLVKSMYYMIKQDVLKEQLIAINDLADDKFEKYVSELEDTSLGELIQLYKEKYVYSDND